MCHPLHYSIKYEFIRFFCVLSLFLRLFMNIYIVPCVEYIVFVHEMTMFLDIFSHYLQLCLSTVALSPVTRRFSQTFHVSFLYTNTQSKTLSTNRFWLHFSSYNQHKYLRLKFFTDRESHKRIPLVEHIRFITLKSSWLQNLIQLLFFW